MLARIEVFCPRHRRALATSPAPVAHCFLPGLGTPAPANVALVFQPAANPELNPAERVWQDLNEQLAWLTFVDLDALERELVERLCADDAATLKA